MTVYYPLSSVYEKADSTIIRSSGWSPPPNGYEFDGVDDDLSVNSNTDINVGNSDFSIELYLKLNSIQSGYVYIFTNRDSGETAWYAVRLLDGILNVYFTDGTNSYNSYISGELLEIDTWYHIIINCDRSEEQVTYYLNGSLKQFTGQSGNLFSDIGDLTNSSGLYIGSNYSISSYSDIILAKSNLYNLLTATETIKLYNNGRPWESRLPSEYFSDGAGVVYQSDFSAGVDGWTGGGTTRAGNIDGVSDGTTSKDDCLRVTLDTSLGGHYIRQTDNNLVANKYQRVSFYYYIPASNDVVKKILVLQSGGTGTNTIIEADETSSGSWNNISAIVDTDDTGRPYVYAADITGNNNIQDIAGDDVFYIKDLKIEALGETFSIRPESVGIYSAYDTSENGNYATVNGATPIAKNDIQRAYKDAITGDTTLTDVIEGGYFSEYFVFENTTANAVTIDVGTSASGNDIISGGVIGANETVLINAGLYTSATDTYYISSADWNSSSLNMKLMSKKL